MTTNKKRVYVLGAGIAGMTVAHELMIRDFDVTVIEKGMFPGGKAATQYPWLDFGISDERSSGLIQVPAEPGFLFFPSFYRHVIDPMERIPFERAEQPPLGRLPAPSPGGDRLLKRTYQTVAENLVPTQMAAMARRGPLPQPIRLAFGSDLRGLLRLSRAGSPYSSEQATNADLERYGLKIWQYLTSCTKRRDSVDKPN